MSPPPQQSIVESLSDEIGGSRVAAAFFSTYTFDRRFFEKEPLDLVTEEGSRRGRLPITVVVDAKRYAGSGFGYEVVRASTNRLWHPKVVALLLSGPGIGETRTVLAVGSGNLTRAGWESNRELFWIESWDRWSLPAALLRWFNEPWLRDSAFGQRLRQAGVQRRNQKPGVQLISSMDAPLWEQLSSTSSVGRWSEAHVVAPFSDRNSEDLESSETAQGFFECLAGCASSARARLDVYLRGIEDRADTVLGNRRVFAWLDRQVDLRLHAIPPKAGRDLHAKLFAWKQGRSWTIVVGSPNATAAAMVQRGQNVELAWEFCGIGGSLPLGLLPSEPSRRFKELRFIEPKFEDRRIWPAVESAASDTKGRVHITWADGYGHWNTRIWFAGRELKQREPLWLGSSIERALMVGARGQSARRYEPAWVPIEMPAGFFDDPAMIANTALTPEEWLARLGDAPWALAGEDGGPGFGPGAQMRKNGINSPGAAFQWSTRVRLLDGQLRGVVNSIREADSAEEFDRLARTLKGAWKSHEPNAPELHEAEVGWRLWVRAGLWQALGELDGRLADHQSLYYLRSKWVKRLPAKLKEFPIVDFATIS